MNFGERLKDLRTEKKITQQQLAEQIGVSKSVVSFYENRERTPSPDVLIKLAAVFHVSADYLLGIERKKSVDVSGLTEEEIHVVRMVVDALRRKNRR